MKKILIYCDTIHIGGHEIQFLNALGLLKNKFDLLFVVNQKNHHLLSELKSLKIKLIITNYSSNRLQIIRNLFSFNQIIFLARIIKNYKPDTILNIQGNIEICSVMLLPAKLLHVNLVTYIPICSKLKAVSKRKFFSGIKDRINNIYFKIPNSFITINEFNKNMILERLPQSKVEVVHNGINFSNCKLLNKHECLTILNLKPNFKYIALIGRIEFWHKGHDIFLAMIEKYQDKLQGLIFLIVGTGSDEMRLKRLIKDKNLSEKILFFGHIQDLSTVYSSIDGVVIPSRFESGAGTPMVLLESLFYGLPVVMSELPEVEGYLNSKNIFTIGDIDEFYEKITSIPYFDTFHDHSRNFVLSRHSIIEFQKCFYNALCKLL